MCYIHVSIRMRLVALAGNSTDLEQKLQKGIRFLLLQTNDTLCESRIDKQRFLASGRMNPDDGMLRLDWLPPNVVAVAAGAFGLRITTMFGAQTLQQCLDGSAKSRICCCLRGPAGVAARGRHRQQCQDGDTRRLVFVGDIGVVSRSRQLVELAPITILVVRPQVNVVELEVTFYVCTDWLR